jgi:hypothetical protein
MVSLNNVILQGNTFGNRESKAKKSVLSRPHICPLCREPMVDGEKTDFRQIPMKGYTTAGRVHAICPEVK